MELRDYLHFERISAAEFARKLGYSENYLRGIVCGALKPGKGLMRIIEMETGGKVTMKDWKNKSTTDNEKN